ncbi:MAG: M1 family metallopeptidase [Gemmatimonadota bacterium]
MIHVHTSARLALTRLLLASLGLCPLSQALAQAPPPSLYLPRNVRQAYAKQTRSPDGRPGAAYWQNRGRYEISIALQPPDRTVRGTETITYFNNSPDTLHRLVFKLLVNIHKPGAARAGNANPAYLTSGVHVDAFTVDGKPGKWPPDGGVFTSQVVALAAPLMPRDSVQLQFIWHYELSRLSGREGAIDSTTFFLAYFYPRVAVYDDYNSWDTASADDRLEFYSDFNDYDVRVSVPANFLVWGTGTLRNASQVLQPGAAGRLEQSFASDTTIRVATTAQVAASAVTAQESMNAWHFTAADVPDVTFAVSNHYNWDAQSVVVDDATHRRASAQAAYSDQARDYRGMARYAAHALDWLSHSWPGVPYPWEHVTVVQGFAGMEYPMMANDESYADTVFSRFVAEHEIAHSYFPFYMGTNETRYSFMDEGWATALEYLISQADLGPDRATAEFKQNRVDGWVHDPSPVQDVPTVTPFTSGNNGYVKPALGYLAVKELLGDSRFRAGLHTYMDRWHGKHPMPWDFFNSMNAGAGVNLDWFWQNWFFSNYYIDLAVTAVTPTASGYRVTIQNIGGMAAPVDVKFSFADGTHETLHQTPAIWQPDHRVAHVEIRTTRRLRSLELDGGIWMDADPGNNRWAAP